MRITYLKLKNFALIYTAMNRTEVEIHFPYTGNRVVLFIGSNGSGKTSLLSQLHPFASPGSLDIRNGINHILDGKDGFKEIHYEHNESIYTIQHFFQYKNESWKTKSFIQKDGNELNPNGNVQSFLEAVKMELSIEPDFLKLTRLGSNVTNFIDMKSAERKRFMNDLLADIDIYSRYYKKINDDNRTLNALMKSVTDNIRKVFQELQHNDKGVVEAELDQMVFEHTKVTGSISTLKSEIGQILGRIEELTGRKTIRELQAEQRTVRHTLVKQEAERARMHDNLDGRTEDEVRTKLSTYSRDLVRIETQLDMTTNTISSLLSRLDISLQQKTENELRLGSIDIQEQLDHIELEIAEKKKIIHAYESKGLEDLQYVLTRSELLTAMSAMQQLEDLRLTILESYGSTMITQVVRMLSDGENIDAFVKHRVAIVDKETRRLTNTMEDIKFMQRANMDETVYVMASPEDHDDATCPYCQFYERISKRKVQTGEVETAYNRLKSLENEREDLLLMLHAQRDVKSIFNVLKSYRDIASRLPGPWLTPRYVEYQLVKQESLFDEYELTEWVARFEDRDDYTNAVRAVETLEFERNRLHTGNDSVQQIQHDLTRIAQDIIEVETLIDSSRATKESLISELADTSVQVDALKELLEEFHQIDTVDVTIARTEKELEHITSVLVTVETLNHQEATKRTELSTLEKAQQRLERAIQNIRYNLRDLEKLEVQQAEIADKFDEVRLIRDALSSTKGMPLLFIQLYFKNATTIINQLLSIVYDNFEVADFVINEKQFDIPYVKNGIRVHDVSSCSQGETSFVTLALSFALISQSIKQYTILLLDEIDATLDEANREAFLSILEHQMDSINSEQVFMITHNNMFDSYPVDVILTSEKNIDNLKNTNIIWSAV